mgnify:FL=1
MISFINKQTLINAWRTSKLSLFLWLSPWIIVLCIIIEYPLVLTRHQERLNYDTAFLITTSIMIIFYVYISIHSFFGIFPPKTAVKDENRHLLNKPERSSYKLSGRGYLLYHITVKSDKEVIYAIILCLKDYIIGKEEIVKSQYSKSIPSTEQIKKYPNDSLKALLSLYYILRPQETDKYYNFDSVIESCIKIVQDKYGQ